MNWSDLRLGWLEISQGVLYNCVIIRLGKVGRLLRKISIVSQLVGIVSFIAFYRYNFSFNHEIGIIGLIVINLISIILLFELINNKPTEISEWACTGLEIQKNWWMFLSKAVPIERMTFKEMTVELERITFEKLKDALAEWEKRLDNR